MDMALQGQFLVEDGLKLLGALVWLTVSVFCLPADARQRLDAESSTEAQERTDGTA